MLSKELPCVHNWHWCFYWKTNWTSKFFHWFMSNDKWSKLMLDTWCTHSKNEVWTKFIWCQSEIVAISHCFHFLFVSLLVQMSTRWATPMHALKPALLTFLHSFSIVFILHAIGGQSIDMDFAFCVALTTAQALLNALLWLKPNAKKTWKGKNPAAQCEKTANHTNEDFTQCTAWFFEWVEKCNIFNSVGGIEICTACNGCSHGHVNVLLICQAFHCEFYQTID